MRVWMKIGQMNVGVVQTIKAVAGIAVCSLAACGGGGGDDGTVIGGIGGVGGSSGQTYTAGVYMPSGQFKNYCANPRVNTSDRPGSTLDENLWLRSWTNELYLWFAEVPDTNPGNMSTATYFDLLVTPAITPSGKDKDNFHFTWNTADYLAFTQSGTTAGYGIEFVVFSVSPPRRAVVAFSQPGSPALAGNIQRGAELATVDGVDFVNGSNVTVINNGLNPSAPGQTHTLGFRDLGSPTVRNVTLVSANVTTTPVQNVGTIATGSGTVGYMLFNDHITTAESQLFNAVTSLKAQGITDLILDIRYNGGGYLYIASELAYMIAGSATTGRTFERTQFNSKYTTTDPVTGQPLTPMPFLNRTQPSNGTTGVLLPTLNLSRVYVLTGPGTCSASESIINGLRGIGLQVIQIGSTTCGKPYGFYPQDNCSTTYFTIQFKGVNEVGFGEYSDGFSPINTSPTAGEVLPGCSVADDFTRALGDSAEGRLAAALNYRATGTCPAPSGMSGRVTIQSVDDNRGEEVQVKSPLRELRILQ